MRQEPGARQFRSIFNLRFFVALLAGVVLILISHYVLLPPGSDGPSESLVRIILALPLS